jgi:hypothetical protein
VFDGVFVDDFLALTSVRNDRDRIPPEGQNQTTDLSAVDEREDRGRAHARVAIMNAASGSSIFGLAGSSIFGFAFAILLSAAAAC